MQKGVIEVENMEFYAFHGCYETEKIVGNKFLVTVALEVDLSLAAQSDNVADTVSYLEVYTITAQQMSITSNIIENVAKRIGDALRSEFPTVTKVTVKISKMHPPLGGQVERASVIINC